MGAEIPNLPQTPDRASLALVYGENAKIAATFWEWRHKVMTHFFTAFAAIVVLAGWFYKELKPWLAVPLALRRPLFDCSLADGSRE